MRAVYLLFFLGTVTLALADSVDARPFSLPWRGWISDPVTGEALHLPQNPSPITSPTPSSQQWLAPFQGSITLPLPEPSLLSEDQVVLKAPGVERELALLVQAYVPLKEWQKLVTEIPKLEQQHPVPAVFDRMEFYLAQAYGYLGQFHAAVLALASAQSINSRVKQRWLTALLSHLS